MEEMNKTSAGSSNGKIILGIIVVLAIAAAVYFMGEAPVQEQEKTVPVAEESKEDTTEVINKEIESVNIEALDASLDADLKAIDEQLNGL